MSSISGSCHCGAVTFEVDPNGRFLVQCNCSICRRLATLWLHAPPAKATVNAPEGSTIAYRWGDKGIAFHTCKTCGCTTHWAGTSGDQLAVNMRLAAPADIDALQIRRFDGADTWEFLD